MVDVSISGEFGYVIVTFVLSVFLLFWLAVQVGKARVKYQVKYPAMYSATCNTFNCIQRAHQNTLENYPGFVGLLFLGGIYSPKLSAVAGVIYLLGRVVYAFGYYTGDPQKRIRGSFQYIGLLILLVNTLLFAAHLIRSGS